MKQLKLLFLTLFYFSIQTLGSAASLDSSLDQQTKIQESTIALPRDRLTLFLDENQGPQAFLILEYYFDPTDDSTLNLLKTSKTIFKECAPYLYHTMPILVKKFLRFEGMSDHNMQQLQVDSAFKAIPRDLILFTPKDAENIWEYLSTNDRRLSFFQCLFHAASEGHGSCEMISLFLNIAKAYMETNEDTKAFRALIMTKNAMMAESCPQYINYRISIGAQMMINDRSDHASIIPIFNKLLQDANANMYQKAYVSNLLESVELTSEHSPKISQAQKRTLDYIYRHLNPTWHLEIEDQSHSRNWEEASLNDKLFAIRVAYEINPNAGENMIIELRQNHPNLREEIEGILPTLDIDDILFSKLFLIVFEEGYDHLASYLMSIAEGRPISEKIRVIKFAIEQGRFIIPENQDFQQWMVTNIAEIIMHKETKAHEKIYVLHLFDELLNSCFPDNQENQEMRTKLNNLLGEKDIVSAQKEYKQQMFDSLRSPK